MARFASPARQAASVMKVVQGKGNVIESVGSVRDYEEALTQVGQSGFLNRLHISLRDMTPELAIQYLAQRAEEVGQSTLNRDRLALQCMLRHVTHQLPPQEKLPSIKSEHAQILASRAYTPEQIDLIQQHQRSANRFSTELAYAAGLRAHELLTLRPVNDQPPDPRPALSSKWRERTGVIYTVHGKGGLTREVLIPHPLAERLEQTRLSTPRHYTDRGVYYTQYYALSGGKRWSDSFTQAAQRALGWSAGAHGTRHSYAQQRMIELQVKGQLDRDQALETVSQEMGHFRPSITEIYLR